MSSMAIYALCLAAGAALGQVAAVGLAKARNRPAPKGLALPAVIGALLGLAAAEMYLPSSATAESLQPLADETQLAQALAEAKGPVLVEFYSPACGACVRLAPVLDDLAGDWKGKAHFYRINVKEAQDLGMQYRIQGYPTMIFFKDGKPVERILGARPRGQIEGVLRDLSSPAVPATQPADAG